MNALTKGQEFKNCFKQGSTRHVTKNTTNRVNTNNQRAIHFYEKFGFVICDKMIVPESNDKINNEEYVMNLEL